MKVTIALVGISFLSACAADPREFKRPEKLPDNVITDPSQIAEIPFGDCLACMKFVINFAKMPNKLD